jgi:hypothetical protein
MKKQIPLLVIYTVHVRSINCQWYGNAHVVLSDNTQNVQYLRSRGTLYSSLLIQCSCLKEQVISHKPCISAHNPLGKWKTCPSNSPPRNRGSSLHPSMHASFHLVIMSKVFSFWNAPSMVQWCRCYEVQDQAAGWMGTTFPTWCYYDMGHMGKELSW